MKINCDKNAQFLAMFKLMHYIVKIQRSAVHLFLSQYFTVVYASLQYKLHCSISFNECGI